VLIRIVFAGAAVLAAIAILLSVFNPWIAVAVGVAITAGLAAGHIVRRRGLRGAVKSVAIVLIVVLVPVAAILSLADIHSGSPSPVKHLTAAYRATVTVEKREFVVDEQYSIPAKLAHEIHALSGDSARKSLLASGWRPKPLDGHGIWERTRTMAHRSIRTWPPTTQITFRPDTVVFVGHNGGVDLEPTPSSTVRFESRPHEIESTDPESDGAVSDTRTVSLDDPGSFFARSTVRLTVAARWARGDFARRVRAWSVATAVLALMAAVFAGIAAFVSGTVQRALERLFKRTEPPPRKVVQPAGPKA
jgi:hypothetical protein